MRLPLNELEGQVARAVEARGVFPAGDTAWACAWLEACAYPGLKPLGEALSDPVRELTLVRDPIGIDLKNVSCAFLAPAILRDVDQHGRVFLRNVRHGLYLLPFAVRADIGIGCPVDPAFALGGERTKNPYAEKIAAAEVTGVMVDEEILAMLTSPQGGR